jgi:hypothetical protein
LSRLEDSFTRWEFLCRHSLDTIQTCLYIHSTRK